MEIILTDLSWNQYQPQTASQARRNVHWTKMSNKDLIFAHNLLYMHESPWVFEAMKEIEARRERGEWINLESSPPPLHELPFLLTIWPLCLLHKQRAPEWGRG